MRLLIAMPVFNERKYVDQVLDKVRRYGYEILVVDDGSTDGTSQVLDRRRDIRVIRHAQNAGYGRSLIDAFQFSAAEGYDWVITMDCDEQHEPERIPDFVRAIRQNRWDIISGSRYLRNLADNDLPPGDRRAINATITEILNDLFQLGLTDAFCGFKAHRVSALNRLELTESGYAFPMQFWPQVARAGLRVREIPVRLIYHDPTRHFGGRLDDAGYRLQHYMDVLKRELARTPAAQKTDAVCCGCRE